MQRGMAETLRELVKAHKLIAAPTGWGQAGRCLELKLPLEIDRLIEEQFFFRATALAHLPHQQVVFQLDTTASASPAGPARFAV